MYYLLVVKMKRKIGWVDGKDNIAVVRYNNNGEIVPIPGNAIASKLEINGSLYVLSPIEGWLSVEGAKIGESLDLTNTEIGSSLYADDVKIGRCLGAEDANIGKWMTLKNAEIGGLLILKNAKIGESLYAEDAKIDGPLVLKNAEIGELITSKNTRFGEIDLRGAKIKEFGGELPEIEVSQYKIDKYTEVPESLTEQLPKYDEVYKQALRV